MSLDQNLFTLLFTPNAADSSGLVTDLCDPSGNVHYRKRRLPGNVYKIEVYDPISDSLLASATARSATSKHKMVELYNPSKIVELKYTGTLMFRWSFKWEEHEFEWKREECFIIRKPDPPVMVAVTKEPAGRIKTASVQILDYNLNRFDIEDRKGLEIVTLTALLTFQDASDAYHESSNDSNVGTPPSATPPPVPPKPTRKTCVERVAEIQTARGEVNEVLIVDECSYKDYAQYCARLLQDEAMLFISICSSGASEVPKVLQVVEETKRIRHKAGDKELYQYVLYDSASIPPKGPKIINLDDNKGKGKGKDYTPPSKIVVHLSKIDMPELRPRTVHERTKDRGVKKSRKELERSVKESSDKARKEMNKREKERATEKAELRPKSSSPALASHLSPNLTSTSQRPHLYPFQSFPLPSQFNNPVGHMAPQLPPRMPRSSLASSSNLHSRYETYPVPSHNRRLSNQHNFQSPVSPPPPQASKLLDKLFGR